MSFSAVFADEKGVPFSLPIVHTTKAKWFASMFERLEFISSKSCDVLNDFYTFFYYGRAAYRPTSPMDKMGATHQLCVFILDTSEFNLALEPNRKIRLHPFDTGAFKTYKGRLDWEGVDLDDFELPGRLSVCPEVQQLFWSDESAYLGCDVTRLCAEPGRHYDDTIVNYHDLVRRSLGTDVDDRCASMEIAVLSPESWPFRIPEKCLRGLVVPQRLLSWPPLIDAISRLGFSVRHYEGHGWAKPTEMYTTVLALAREIIGK